MTPRPEPARLEVGPFAEPLTDAQRTTLGRFIDGAARLNLSLTIHHGPSGRPVHAIATTAVVQEVA